MTDIPALQGLETRVREQLERLAELNRRLGRELSPRMRKFADLTMHGLEVVEGLLFYLELEMRTAVAENDALERALCESLGEDPSGILATIRRECERLGVPSIDLGAVELDHEVVIIIPRELAIKHQLIAFGWLDEGGKSHLQVAMVDPTNTFAFNDVRFAIGHEIKVYLASEDAIARAIEKYYPRPDPERA